MRKSLDQIEKEVWNPGPSLLETPVIAVDLKEESAVPVFKVPELALPSLVESSAAVLDPQSLNDTWTLAQGGAEEERLKKADWPDAVPAQVPGSIHTALFEAGLIPDPMVGQNDKIAREKSYQVWWLKRKFTANPGAGLVNLEFDGICYHGKIWLNGIYLGAHRGMFGKWEKNVGALLQPENTLIVKIENAPARPAPMSPHMDNDEGWHDGVVINCVYGWHYACLPSRGIWAPVRLAQEKDRSTYCEPPFVAATDARKGQVDVCLQCEGENGSGSLSAYIREKGGDKIYTFSDNWQQGWKLRHFQIRIPDPQLWWPNGHGAQPLYELVLAYKPSEGPVQVFETTFGIRTIEMAPLPGGPREDRHNWTYVVNGKPVFIKGTNWCTTDALLRFTEESYQRFLTMARDQHINLLRAWGGGMPESDVFYRLCDELGIMVMQEWPTCWDSQKDQPYGELEETVLHHMPRLRNHPSLIMWCGGNESRRADGPAMDMMARYAYELDGSRPFHRTSPWGGATHNYATYWDMEDMDASLQLESPFLGEFGMASVPNYESVMRYLPEEEREQWPPERFGSFGHHTPRFNQLDPCDMDHLSKQVPEFTAAKDMKSFIWATQMAQATAIRHTLESYRCRWPWATGICYYKINDVYPGASWATVDYYGVPKLSYYVIKDSYEPLHACVTFKSIRLKENTYAPVYLLDDNGALNGEQWQVQVRCYDQEFQIIGAAAYKGQGRVSTEAVSGIKKLGEVLVPRNAGPVLVMVQLIVGNEVADRTFYWLNYHRKPGCLLEFPQTTLEYQVGDGEITVENTGQYPAAAVEITCPSKDTTFVTERSMFWLEAGERISVKVNETAGICVRAFNSQ